MKRILSIFLAIMFSCSIALAETDDSREMTSDEQAYNIYLDIAHVYEYGVRYLEELGRIWDIALNAKDVSAINYMSYSDTLTEEPLTSLIEMYLVRYGYSSTNEVRQKLFATNVFSVSEKTELIWVLLDVETESHYLESPEALKTYLNRAVGNIRTLMAADKEYPFLSELQAYYKDAVQLQEYIANFKDNYTDFTAQLRTYKANLSSWKVDFEFIFDPSDYAYVHTVHSIANQEAAQEIYDRAFQLESSGDYAGAIELYWQCYPRLAVVERIEACRGATKEPAYQEAVACENNAQYSQAIAIYQELDGYKDSAERIQRCTYNMAAALEDQGKYAEAMAIYQSIPNYADAQARIKVCVLRSVSSFGDFNDGVSVVRFKNGLYGAINDNLELLFTTEYTLYDFNEGYAVAQFVKDYGNTVIRGIYNTSGTFVLGPSNALRNMGDDVSDGMIYNVTEYIEIATGNRIKLSVKEHVSTPFVEGLRRTKDTNGKYGYIDHTGKFVISAQYTYTTNFHDGYAIVSKESGDNRQYLVIDKTGKTVLQIPKGYGRTTAYQGLNGFYDGLCMVAKNGKCGYIDMQGNLVISCQYDSADNFCNGMARVVKDGKNGYINTSGELIIPFEYDEINGSAFTAQGVVLVRQGTEYSVLRNDGTVVIQPGYNKIILSDGPIILAYKDQVWYGLDCNGNILY